MKYMIVGCVLGGWLALAACEGAGAAGSESAAKLHAADLSVPSAEGIRVTFEAATLPSWRVDYAGGNKQIAREIQVVKGRPMHLLVSGDREWTLEIPAMRVRMAAPSDRFQTAWFTPITPGEYEVLVRSGSERYDGKIVVVDK